MSTWIQLTNVNTFKDGETRFCVDADKIRAVFDRRPLEEGDKCASIIAIADFGQVYIKETVEDLIRWIQASRGPHFITPLAGCPR